MCLAIRKEPLILTVDAFQLYKSFMYICFYLILGLLIYFVYSESPQLSLPEEKLIKKIGLLVILTSHAG